VSQPRLWETASVRPRLPCPGMRIGDDHVAYEPGEPRVLAKLTTFSTCRTYALKWAGHTGWSRERPDDKAWEGLGHELFGGSVHGPAFMTPVIFWALLAVTVAVVIGIAKFIAAGKARAEALRARNVHRIDPTCAVNGHAYLAYDTGWRCATCGNHVSGRDGELYGLAKNGRHERRRRAR
jgi:hypothetical protein